MGIVDNFFKRHFVNFPVRVLVLRSLADEIDPWPYQYEGLDEVKVEPTTDGSVEVHSVFLRKKYKGHSGRKLAFFVLLAVFGGILGWVLGLGISTFLTGMYAMLGGVFLSYALIALLATLFGVFGWKIGAVVELIKTPPQPQAAYQSNKDSDVLWLLQTGKLEYHPCIWKNKQIVAMIESWVPEEYEMQDKVAPMLDSNGQPVLEGGQILYEKVMDPKTNKPVRVPVTDAKTGAPRVLRWSKQLKPVTIFDANFFLSGDASAPVVKKVPYAVAYKSSDLYQWLLLQAERQKFYLLQDFWGKYGNILAMLVAGVVIVLVVAVGLQQYAQVAGQWVDGAKKIVEAESAHTQAIVDAIKWAATNSTRYSAPG